MLACDQCGLWYHGDCVGISEEIALDKQDTPFICPNCEEPGISDLVVDAKWYPNGPSFSFFPYPVIDTKRPYGLNCNECGNNCYGHYVTNIKELLQMYSAGNAIRAEPPSCIIERFFDSYQGSVSSVEDSQITKLSKKCLLSPEDVKLWLDNLSQVSENRKRGIAKAKATRARKKQK